MTNTQTLTILATSDIHGHIYPTTYRGNSNQPLGLAKLATIIEIEKQKSANTLLIDNGDIIQGSPLMYSYHHSTLSTNPIIEAMNLLGFDAGVLGNHEFNFGRSAIDKAVSASHFPWLSANVLDQDNNQPIYGKPYVIKETDSGIKVAILGVTTHYIPNWEKPDHIKGVHFSDAFETTDYWVTFIREHEAVDVLIVSYHGGFERDLTIGEPTEKLTGENQGYRILTEIDGIDVLLTGHQHRKIAQIHTEKAVIQPGVNGEALGKVTLDLSRVNDTWTINHKHAELIPVTDETPVSETISLVAREAHQQTEIWLDKPVGYVDGDLSVADPFQLRLATHPLITFINSVQEGVAQVDISLTSLFHDQAPGFSGEVTMREIVSNYIFPNTLAVLELTGKDIRQALELSASYFQLDEEDNLTINPDFLYPKPAPYNYDMWSGIDYQLSISQPIGKRVTELYYQGQPIKEEDTFHVVMNNYRASGGGNFDMFKDKPVIKEIQTDMTELLVEYFTEHPVVVPEYKTNFTVTR